MDGDLAFIILNDFLGRMPDGGAFFSSTTHDIPPLFKRAEELNRRQAEASNLDSEEATIEQLEPATSDLEPLTSRTIVTMANRKAIQKFYSEHNTSSEDEEGQKRPKLGAGLGGHGPPLTTSHLGKKKAFHNGAGLASPGRWAPYRRNVESSGTFARMRLEVLKLLIKEVNIVKTLALLATGKCTESPFPDELVLRGRIIPLEEVRGYGTGLQGELLFCQRQCQGAQVALPGGD